MKQFISFLLVTFSSVIAQGPLNYLSSTDGGASYEVCYYNNLLYVGAANTLMVFDLTGPNQTPGNLLYKERLASNIDFITVNDGQLFVCANHAGLFKYDIITSPAFQLDLIASLSPNTIHESVYDVAFYGDTVAIAAKNKLFLYQNNPTNFSYVNTVESTDTSARIHGVDIKGRYLTYTVANSVLAGLNGIYLYDMLTMTPVDFYSDEIGSAWDVVFGQQNNLIHVMGGQLGIGLNGYYYVLDYSTPGNLMLAFSDTIQGAGISFAMPMNAININDTIYIATQGGINLAPGPLSHSVYVYDATDSSSIHLITDIYAGLYHFDVDIKMPDRIMYVASEWYGIQTMDVADIFNEVELGKKLTGGWCHGSAYRPGLLVEANEGFGVRLFDMSDMLNPTLMAQDTTVGFCRSISFTQSGEYMVAWYLTGKGVRVYDTNLVLVADTIADASILLAADFQKSRSFQNHVAVIEQVALEHRRILVANITNPLQPFVQSIRRQDWLRDICWHNSGKLFGLSHDTINVYDTSLQKLTHLAVPPFRKFKSLTISGDTIFVFAKKFLLGFDELYTYHFDNVNDTLILLSSASYPMMGTDRIFMANDEGLVYITSTLDRLRAIRKSDFQLIDSYDHSADFMYDDLWGIQDLYLSGSFLFLNEYMGHTSIFGPNPLNSQPFFMDAVGIEIFPNPTNEITTIYFNQQIIDMVYLVDLEGRIIYNTHSVQDPLQLNVVDWKPGLYFINFFSGNQMKSKKLLVIK